MRAKLPVFGQEAAEALAFHAIAIMVADEELLPRFLANTGCGMDDLRERMNDPDFLGAVLDFVLEDDSSVQKVAEAAGVSMDSIQIARSKLPGAQQDWSP